jgi:predicted nucleic acid-binding protein
MVISQLARVELESVLAIKSRSGVLTAAQKSDIRYRLSADLASGRLKLGLAIQIEDYPFASRLLDQFGESLGLRTLDALHLAIALRAARQSWISAFVSADKRLCTAARAAGCPAIEVTAE